MYLDAQGQDGLDLSVQQMPGETVAGNAVAEHTAQLLGLLKHGNLMTHERQIVGAAQSAGAAAYNGHSLAGGRSALRLGYISGVIHGVTLQTPDVDGVVNHIAAAPGLAGMLADVGAGSGEGVILSDQAHGVGAAIFAHQSHVAGNIHPGGTQGDAWHGVFKPCQAPLMEDVLLVVIPESLQAVHHQAGRIPADGTVRRVDDGAGGFFNGNQSVHCGCAGEDLLQKHGKLSQTDAAGHALAAALSVAQPQKTQSHVHGTQARGAGGDTAFHVTVEIFHHSLGLAGRLDIQSAHIESLLFCNARIIYQ